MLGNILDIFCVRKTYRDILVANKIESKLSIVTKLLSLSIKTAVFKKINNSESTYLKCDKRLLINSLEPKGKLTVRIKRRLRLIKPFKLG